MNLKPRTQTFIIINLTIQIFPAFHLKLFLQDFFVDIKGLNKIFEKIKDFQNELRNDSSSVALTET